MEKPKNTNGGRPDPTYNVSELVNTAVQRLDDLAEVRYNCIKDEIKLNKEIMNLHITYNEKLRASDEKLSLAESKRIDAIRAVDVGAVAIDSEKQKAQATVLANQLTTSADTLRTQQQQQFAQLSDRISSIDKALSEGIGKGRVTDPIMEKLLLKVETLVDSRSTSTGKSAGISMVTGLLITIGFMVVALVGLAIKVFGG